MKLGTFCSGIGAPEVASDGLFDPIWFSEIEKFPSAVLKHHWPNVPNLGDMTTPDIVDRIADVGVPDVVVAGTPCQDFSIAGLRAGTDGERGNLTLQFVRICHAIVNARHDGRLCVLWENVPGVLSDKGNAFGNFLGGLVGSLDALPPPGNGSWPGEGMVQGPRARAAWAVLDAQWFGVAQRRRRVFVVIDFGNCVDPAAVLLEPDRLRGDSPPSREAGQGTSTDVAPSLTGSGRGVERIGETRGQDPVVATNSGDVGYCLAASAQQSLDAETETLIAFKPSHYTRGKDGAPSDVFPPLSADADKGDQEAVIAFDCKGSEVQSDDTGVTPPLRSMGHNHSHQNAGGHAAVAIQERAVSENMDAGPGGAGFRDDDTAFTLESRQTTQAVAFAQNTRDEVRLQNGDGSIAGALAAEAGMKQTTYVTTPQVRRLMPVECARLQGFPDDHTVITYRGKPAADGPQYKAYGNSMAVPVVRWIMDRIKISMEEKRSS